MMRCNSLLGRVLGVGLFWLVSVPASWAQQKPPPPNPNAPNLNMLFPAGIQRGTSLELTLTGTNLANPTGFWSALPAKITIPTEDKNGTDAAKLKVRLDVPVAVGAPSAIEGTVWDEFVGSLTASRPAVGRAPGSRSPLSGFR